MHRIGFLKKFCMNILFLSARRAQQRQGWEEVLFALAAGVAMAFATAVAFWAQARYTQASLNFFLIMVVGYMMKDRIKEGLRRIFSQRGGAAPLRPDGPHRGPGDGAQPGHLRGEGGLRPRGAGARGGRRRCAAGTTSSPSPRASCPRRCIRYQKQMVLDAELLPRTERGVSGITDIIRLNVERFLRDMDEPEYALEYVDLEDFSRGAGARRQELPGGPGVPLHRRGGGAGAGVDCSWCGWCWTATASSGCCGCTRSSPPGPSSPCARPPERRNSAPSGAPGALSKGPWLPTSRHRVRQGWQDTLRGILEQARSLGSQAVLAFDLDSTLFDNRPRQARILREFGQRPGAGEAGRL